MKTTTVTVTVAGKSYQLSGLEEKEHFTHLAEMTNRRIREVAGQNPSLSAEACAVAACFSLADELIKAQALSERLRQELETKQQETRDEA